jgi:hypothetical protein
MKKTIATLFILIFFSGCVQVQQKSVCGNGVVEIGEECDDSPCPIGKICENCKCILPSPPTIPPSQLSNINYFTAYNTEVLRTREHSNYVITINVFKGWNLIPASYGYIVKNGMNIEDIQGYSEIDEKDILVGFIFDPENQKYLSLESKEFNDFVNRLKSDSKLERSIRASSVWAYIRKGGKMRYYLYNPTFMPKLGDIPLYKGWNLIHITPQMVGLSLNEIKGDCNILGLYDWIESEQKWSKGITDFGFRFKDENVGNTMLIRVKEECTFDLIVPSALP